MSPTPTDPNQAQAWITGDPPDQTIDFYIPRGNTGPMGPVGPQGPSLVVGAVETNMGPAAPGTIGPQGLTGPKGDPGGIVIGTVIASNTDWNTLTTDGVYRIAGQTGQTNAPIIPYGILYVNNVEAVGIRLVQTFYPDTVATGGRTIYQRAYAGGIWQPWRSFNATRIDNTAGRAIYHWDNTADREQLIYGDTGWREIVVPVVTNNVVSGNIRLRRVGNEVTMFTVDLILSTAVTGYATLLTAAQIPVGFRPFNGYRSMQAIGLTNNAIEQQWITNFGELGWTHKITSAGAYSNVRPSVALYGSLSWFTDEVWPTSLPGTAIGSIPNT